MLLYNDDESTLIKRVRQTGFPAPSFKWRPSFKLIQLAEKKGVGDDRPSSDRHPNPDRKSFNYTTNDQPRVNSVSYRAWFCII